LRLFNADTIEGTMYYLHNLLANAESERSHSREAVMVHHAAFFADRHKQGLKSPPELGEGLLRALAELEFGGQTAETVARAADWLHARRDWPVAQVFNLLLDRVRPRAGIDKTPLTAMSPQAMERVYALCPRARFLHLA